MKTYNLDPIEKEFSFGKMEVISLGMGRKREVYVPYHAPTSTDEVEIATTQKGNYKIVKAESGKSKSYLAKLDYKRKSLFGNYYNTTTKMYCDEETFKNYGLIAGSSESLLVEIPYGSFVFFETKWSDYGYLHFKEDEVVEIPACEIHLYVENFNYERPKCKRDLRHNIIMKNLTNF